MRCAAENAANGRKSYDIGAHPITGAGILRDTAAPSSLNPTETTPQRLRGATLIGISPWRANHEQGRSLATKFSSQYSSGLHGCGSNFTAGRTRCGSRGNTRTPLAGDGGIVSPDRTRQGRQPSAPQAGDRLTNFPAPTRKSCKPMLPTWRSRSAGAKKSFIRKSLTPTSSSAASAGRIFWPPSSCAGSNTPPRAWRESFSRNWWRAPWCSPTCSACIHPPSRKRSSAC